MQRACDDFNLCGVKFLRELVMNELLQLGIGFVHIHLGAHRSNGLALR